MFGKTASEMVLPGGLYLLVSLCVMLIAIDDHAKISYFIGGYKRRYSNPSFIC